MCGVVADFQAEGGVEARRVEAALDRLAHRGPDGRGVWISPDRRVVLGHVRLAVIDPTGSPQPIVSEDGWTWLVVNGEFYGYEEMRNDLVRRGHRFRTGGDSEVALHLYEEYGLDFIRRLRGEFSLVLWDGRRERLVAARDRFGVKPLCYAQAGGRLTLASEAKALFELGVRPAWDGEAFHQVCGMQYPPPDRTLFAGVRQLPPGCFLLARAGLVETRPYWDMDHPPEGRKARRPPDEQGRRLRHRLGEAVRLRLRADAPVCFHLSGGLDSASVVALALPHLERPPVCFTVGFDAPGYDEREAARRSAEHLGAELRAVRVSQEDVTEHLADAVYFSEGLAINGHLPAKYLLARAIRKAGFEVVLSGEGADEALGGYAHLRQDLLVAGPDDADGRARLREGNAMMAGIHLPEGEGLPLGAVREALGYVPTFLQAKATLGARMHGVLCEDFLNRFRGRDPFREFLGCFDVPGQLLGRHPLDASSYLWSKSSLATYILRTLGDGTEMAHSVEGRLPFLDHVFFEEARELPAEVKIRDGVGKFILREALKDTLPEEVRNRGKQPFTAPPLSLVGGRGEELMQDVLRGRRLADCPFFDREKMVSLLDRLPSLSQRERVATDPVLMLALTACLLQERFGL
jgi:asparagine synthase (glutamine-hydrolysing)